MSKTGKLVKRAKSLVVQARRRCQALRLKKLAPTQDQRASALGSTDVSHPQYTKSLTGGSELCAPRRHVVASIAPAWPPTTHLYPHHGTRQVRSPEPWRNTLRSHQRGRLLTQIEAEPRLTDTGACSHGGSWWHWMRAPQEPRPHRLWRDPYRRPRHHRISVISIASSSFRNEHIKKSKSLVRHRPHKRHG